MQVALRKGDGDAFLPEIVVDGLAQITFNYEPLTDIGNPHPQFEVERAFTETGEEG